MGGDKAVLWCVVGCHKVYVSFVVMHTCAPHNDVCTDLQYAYKLSFTTAAFLKPQLSSRISRATLKHTRMSVIVEYTLDRQNVIIRPIVWIYEYKHASVVLENMQLRRVSGSITRRWYRTTSSYSENRQLQQKSSCVQQVERPQTTSSFLVLLVTKHKMMRWIETATSVWSYITRRSQHLCSCNQKKKTEIAEQSFGLQFTRIHCRVSFTYA